MSHLIVKQLEIPPALLDELAACEHRLTPDFSGYARGRRRLWIGAEGPLRETDPFKAGTFGYDSELWQLVRGLCRQLDFEPQLALLHRGGADCSDPEDEPENGHGGECGIKRHRDAGYADYRAVGINLQGTATFGYREDRVALDRVPNRNHLHPKVHHVPMVPGTGIVFNCKNLHWAQCGPRRWAINAWRVSAKRAEHFLRWIEEHEIDPSLVERPQGNRSLW